MRFPFFHTRQSPSVGPRSAAVTAMLFGAPATGKSTLMEELCAYLRTLPVEHGWDTPIVLATPPRTPFADSTDPTAAAYPHSTATVDYWAIQTSLPVGRRRVVFLDTAGELVREEAVPDVEIRVPVRGNEPSDTANESLRLRDLFANGVSLALVCVDAARCDTALPEPGQPPDDIGRTLAHLTELLAQPQNRDCKVYLLYTKADEYGLPVGRDGPLVRTAAARAALAAYRTAREPAEHNARWAAFTAAVADRTTPHGRTICRLLDRTRGFYGLARFNRDLPVEPYLVAARPPQLVPTAMPSRGGCLALLRDMHEHLTGIHRRKHWQVAAAAGIAAAGIAAAGAGFLVDAQRRDIAAFQAAIGMPTHRAVTPADWNYDAATLVAGGADRPSPFGPDRVARHLVMRRLAEWSADNQRLVDATAERASRATSPMERAAVHAQLRDDVLARTTTLETAPAGTAREAHALDKTTGDPECLAAVAAALADARAVADAADAVARASGPEGTLPELMRLAAATRDAPARVRAPGLNMAAAGWLKVAARDAAADHPIAAANLLRGDGPAVEAFARAAGIEPDPYRFAAGRLGIGDAFDRPVEVPWSSLPRVRTQVELRDAADPSVGFSIDFGYQTVSALPARSEQPAKSGRVASVRWWNLAGRIGPALCETGSGAERALRIVPGRLVVTRVRVGRNLDDALHETRFGPTRGTEPAAGLWLPAAVTAVRSRAAGAAEPALRLDLPDGVPPASLGELTGVLTRLCPSDPFTPEVREP